MHTKSAADANPLAKEYEDITLNCRDCNAEFIFSAGEQEFYQSKGWENQPTRCVECKNAKKARFGEGPSAGVPAGVPAGHQRRRPRLKWGANAVLPY